MGLYQSGVPRREDTPCFITPCLSFPPGVGSHRSTLAPESHYIRAVPAQHMVNKAYTRWVAANLISGHLVDAGNHRHGTAGHRQGKCSVLKAVVFVKPMAFGQGSGCHGGLMVLSCNAMRGKCDNCSHTHTQAHLHKSAHCPCKVTRQSVDWHSVIGFSFYAGT